ncbi:tail fibers protein [Salmonella phage vB_SenP_UTK0002]|nr:tail fibers protein [Salmonella phage vB_SenP_UTK0002]
MRKILIAVGLTLASLSFASVAKDNDNNSRGDVTVVGDGTGSVHISQCASTWNCNNSELNVEFTGDVENVTINGEHTVIKGQNGKDGIDGKDGANGKDGINGIDGAKGDKGDKGDTGASGKDGKDGLNGENGKDGLNGTNGLDGAKGDKGDEGKQGIAGIAGLNGKDADMTQVNANTEANKSISKRQDAFEKSTNQRFANMDKRIDENRKNASAGIAGVAAMANIPQVSQNSSFSVGAGVGSYDSEQGLAVGMSARFNENIVTKASVAATTQDDFVFGAGVSYEW